MRVNGISFTMNRDPLAGPFFETALKICSNSNLISKSSSQLGFSYKLDKTPFKWDDSLAEQKEFLVKEIEVYKCDTNII